VRAKIFHFERDFFNRQIWNVEQNVWVTRRSFAVSPFARLALALLFGLCGRSRYRRRLRTCRIGSSCDACVCIARRCLRASVSIQYVKARLDIRRS
jgi:hypothetical protein